MIPCTELSDRMPDVAHGRSRWTAAEEHHLAACDSCRAEWELATTAVRLGATLPPPGDPVLVTALMIERLNREREILQRRLRIWTLAGLAAAAAVIIAIWTSAATGALRGGASAAPRVASAPATAPTPVATPAPVAAVPPVAPGAVVGSRAELPFPEIEDKPPEALESILNQLNEPAARADAYDLPGLDDSGDGELEAVLTGLEG
jgi:hypothetical protein